MCTGDVSRLWAFFSSVSVWVPSGSCRGSCRPPRTPLRPRGCAPGPLLSSKKFLSKRKISEKFTFRGNQCIFVKNLVFPCKNLPWEALVAIFGIYVKNAAQRWGRELRSSSVALFPSDCRYSKLLWNSFFCLWNLGSKKSLRNFVVLDPSFLFQNFLS